MVVAYAEQEPEPELRLVVVQTDELDDVAK